ncbi:hypothetical protein DFP73DRAFT_562267 [Morchella snyderi]|nr:hypothetical protein DFP73DRAFT_562267 [Morchella snyderi]
MPPVLNQVDIPTLPLLYHIKRISVNEKPLATPSATLNAKIGLIRTDITKLHLPNGAIVNAANENLTPGGGVCGAIHSAAGPELTEECRRLNGCKTGYAKVTRAYRLPCRKLIHAVGPIYRLAKEINEHETNLSSCYTETLKLAIGNGLTAVAFCALSTGIYGYPSYEAAGTAISTVRSFLESEEGQKLELVIFCNFEKKDEDAYSELISIYFPPAGPETNIEKTGTVDVTKHCEAKLIESIGNPLPGPLETRPTGIPSSKEDPKEAVSPSTVENSLKQSTSVPVNLTEGDGPGDFILIDKDEYKTGDI